jgi:hypothetical protein
MTITIGRPAERYGDGARKLPRTAGDDTRLRRLEEVPLLTPQRSFIVAGLRRLARSDRWALAIFVALPLAVFAVPALFGHVAIVGDDATQNYPLRELAGSLIRHGHLPLLDPYVWSGAPLLGGWNAGAAYPFIAFFVLLPGKIAWTLTLVVTWWVAGLGSFAFLRASRLSPLPSFVGAFSFSFAGAMTAQISHIGLVEGMSWAPLVLLGLLKLSELSGERPTSGNARRTLRRSRLGWAALLAGSASMVVLAGEPRAITNVAVIAGVYGTWRAVRLGRNAAPYLAWVAGGLLFAFALGAIQWLPGEAALATSQRASASASLFASGSLPGKWLLLMFVPDLLGGSGSFGQPAFLAQYNLIEVTGYVGLMPLVATFALLGRLRVRPRLPEWLVWHVMALVGIVFALGGNTPLWHILIKIPLFGGQRFQSRNIGIADMAFAFLLAYWSEVWLTEARARRAALSAAASANRPVATGVRRARRAPLPGIETRSARNARLFGAAPAVLAVALSATGLALGPGLLRWLDVSLRLPAADSRLRWWFLPFGALGVTAAVLSIWGHRLRERRAHVALLGVVVADVVLFSLLTLVPVLPDLGFVKAAAKPASIGAKAIFPKGLAPAVSPVTAATASKYTGSGRFAVYDPNAIDANQLNEIEAPDLNVLSGLASVEGYGSIVDGSYASATGTHSPAGDRGDVLDPSAVAGSTLDSLDTTALFAPRDYFLISGPTDPAKPDPAAGARELAAGGRATWYLGGALSVASLVVSDENAAADVNAGLRFGVLTTGGATLWAPAPTRAGAQLLKVMLALPVRAVAVVAQAMSAGASLGAPSITTASGASYVADGQLEAAVQPPHWLFKGLDGSFAVFSNSFARPGLTLRGSSGATIKATAGPAYAPSAAAVSSLAGVEVVRSVAAIPGWKATWRPSHGPAVVLPVASAGTVQMVKVPAGSGVLSFAYDPPGWTLGWILSTGALAIGFVILLPAVTRGRKRQRRRDSTFRPTDSLWKIRLVRPQLTPALAPRSGPKREPDRAL